MGNVFKDNAKVKAMLKVGMKKYQVSGSFLKENQSYTGIGAKFHSDKELSEIPEVVALYAYSLKTNDVIVGIPNNRAFYDGLAASGKKVEVKDDARSSETGNFAFEVESRGNPAAIQLLNLFGIPVLLYWGPPGKNKTSNGVFARELFLFEGVSLKKLLELLQITDNGFDEALFKKSRIGRVIEPSNTRMNKLLVIPVKYIVNKTHPEKLSQILLNDNKWKKL